MNSLTLKVVGSVVIILSLSACGNNDRPVYQGAEYYKNLEVPPDLTEPDTGDELRVPKPTEEALQRFRDNNKLETVITPKFDGVRMVSYAGNSWIEVDNNVEHVWTRLAEFWEAEGIELAQVRPELGFMETEWTEKLSADVGFFRSIFQRFEPDQKDKFRVRVERFDLDRKTRLYIAHSRIEKHTSGEYAEDYSWVTLPSDLEVEREIISRMALFAGRTREDTVQLLENYRPYSSLINIDSTNTTALTMTGSMDFVWRRTVRALDRMRVQELQQDKSGRTMTFMIGKISSEELHTEASAEDDDLAESSWLMQLFTDVDEKNIKSDTSRHYRLDFTNLKGRVQVDVKDTENTKNIDEDGDVTGTALAEQLRNLLIENLE